MRHSAEVITIIGLSSKDSLVTPLINFYREYYYLASIHHLLYPYYNLDSINDVRLLTDFHNILSIYFRMILIGY